MANCPIPNDIPCNDYCPFYESCLDDSSEAYKDIPPEELPY